MATSSPSPNNPYGAAFAAPPASRRHHLTTHKIEIEAGRDHLGMQTRLHLQLARLLSLFGKVRHLCIASKHRQRKVGPCLGLTTRAHAAGTT